MRVHDYDVWPTWALRICLGVFAAIAIAAIVAGYVRASATAAEKRACLRSGRVVVVDLENEWTCREVKP